MNSKKYHADKVPDLYAIFHSIVDDVAGGLSYIAVSDQPIELKYTKKQRGSLHVWCDQCAQVMNENGMTCEVLHPFTKQVYEMPWTGGLFKENIYKWVLSAMTGKSSTEDQSTAEPSEVALVISKRFAENGLICPPWPSRRG